MSNFRIATPNAAIIIWNYDDRLGSDNTEFSEINTIDEVIVSTLSCQSIQTSKSKGSPVGSFTVNLAPTRNWVSEITAGSWCAILMANRPLTQQDFKKATPDTLKMIGKIEGVTCQTVVEADGTRHTSYIMSGVDWAYIFENIIYIDNLIAAANDPLNQGNTIAAILQNQMLAKGGTPQSFAVDDNLTSLLGIFGISSTDLSNAATAINRLGKSTYDFLIPTEMAQYCSFIDADNNVNLSNKISDLLTLQTGKLIAYNSYQDSNEAFGYIDPFSLQGINTFWQILMDNSNPAMNEMYNEIEWDSVNGQPTSTVGPSLTIYKRIKPFCYRTDISRPATAQNLLSQFNYIKTHTIDNQRVISVTANTNWRDKYNFIEIRPQFSDFNAIGNWTATKVQEFDQNAFNREGFRPLIVGTKQFPVSPDKAGNFNFNADNFIGWKALMREWYFDTHKLLSGKLTLYGAGEYIGVGNNILFDLTLLNPTNNFNIASVPSSKKTTTNYILAHVENVRHTFSNIEGTRTFTTEIDFVRGLVTDASRNIIGSGSLDENASNLARQFRSTVNNFGQSAPMDPDPKKSNGTA